MQVTHPLTGVVMLQMVLPTSEGCAFIRDAMTNSPNPAANKAVILTACRSSTAPDMNYYAVLHDKIGDFDLDIQAKGGALCQAWTESIKTVVGLEVLKTCAPI